MPTLRQTKYTNAVRAAVTQLGHASNADIIKILRAEHPDISATTVHRITTRLHDSGQLTLAPNKEDGAMRYDCNTVPHDHFLCSGCDRVRDLHIAEQFIPRIEKALGGCKVTGKLVISGSCETCIKNKKGK